MKNHLLLFFLLTLLTFPATISARKDILVSSMTCEIHGHLSPSCQDSVAYLMSSWGQEGICLDSSPITDGQFHFSIAACDTPYVAYIVLRPSLSEGIPLMMDADLLDFHWNKTDACYQVSGSSTNEELSSLSSRLLHLLRTHLDSISHYSPFPLSPTGWKLGKNLITPSLKNNKDNILGLFLLSQCSQMLGVTEAEKYFVTLPSLLSHQQLYRQLAFHLETEKKSMRGDDYHELTLQSMEGDTVHLSDFCNDGQFTIFCFWESGHAAFQEELPALKRIYNDFNGRGIEIIGISLDQDEHLWHQSVHTLQLPFKQYRDVHGKARQVYGILSLPMTIVISPNFRILRKNLFGEELYNACRSWAF